MTKKIKQKQEQLEGRECLKQANLDTINRTWPTWGLVGQYSTVSIFNVSGKKVDMKST